MKSEKVVVKVKLSTLREMQELLDREEIDFIEEGISMDSTYEIFTGRFSDGYVADIKVCSGDNNFFIDPVLFDNNGYEACVLDCAEELVGEHIFEAEDKEYILEIMEG